MAVKVTLKDGDLSARTPTRLVESFDGEDDEYWFENEGKLRVLKVYRAIEKTTKTYAPDSWLTVDGKERELSF
jgi:hypothetical protein